MTGRSRPGGALLPAGFLSGQHRFLSAAARQPDPYLHRPSILWPLRQEVSTTTPPRLLRPPKSGRWRSPALRPNRTTWGTLAELDSGICFLTWIDTPDYSGGTSKLWELLQG